MALPIEEARALYIAERDRPPGHGPRVEPCVCTAGRHEHGGRKKKGGCTRTGCARYRRNPADVLLRKAQDGVKRGFADDLQIADRKNNAERAARKTEGTVRVSASDASSCRRQIQYRERPPADFYRSWEDKRAAWIGSLIHDASMRIRTRIYPWRRYERDVHIDGLGTSRYDQYDPITAVLDDTKTAGDWKWDLITEDGPPESEWEQASIYAKSVEDEGDPVDEVTITYVQRAQGKDVVFRRPYDRAYAERAIARLIAVATQIELGITQPRDRTGPSSDPVCARYCFARDYCWNIPEAERNGRSPESWTLLGVSPEDERVEQVLQAYVDARTREGAAAKEKGLQKVLTQGLAHREYGALRLGVTLTNRTDQNAYLMKVVAWAQQPEEDRCPFEEIIKPLKEIPSIKIGPVPKAERERRAREAAKHAKEVAAAEAMAVFGPEEDPS